MNPSESAKVHTMSITEKPDQDSQTFEPGADKPKIGNTIRH